MYSLIKGIRSKIVDRLGPKICRMSTDQVLSHLANKPSSFVIDLTFGDGSDTRRLLRASESSRVIGVDCDPCVNFESTKQEFGDRFDGFVSKWSQLPSILKSNGESDNCDLIIIEMGPSSSQIEDLNRGFDKEKNGILDLRYNQGEGTEAKKLLKHIDVDTLQKILKVYGGTIKAKAVASQIVEQRYLMKTITTTEHLNEVLVSLHENDRFWMDRGEGDIEENITSVYRALRLFTNNEISEIYFAIRMAELVLEKSGILMIKTSSKFEKNILQKYIFRNSGPSGSLWKMITEDSLEMTFSKV